MSRSVLITGAGGFVCSHLAEGFRSLGDAVTGLDATFDAATRARLGGITLVEATLTPEALAELGRFDLVIHGAALTSDPELLGLSPAEHARCNVTLMLTSLDFAVRREAASFVLLSSSGVFLGSNAAWLLESTPPCSTTPYALAKLACEALLALAPPSVRTLALRLGPIYGPNERSRPSSARVSLVCEWLDDAVAGRPITVVSPQSCREWTYAPDLARAMEALLQQPALSGVVHLCAPEPVTDEALAEQIGELTGSPVRIQATPGQPRRPMASERLDLPRLIDWTCLAAGLRLTRTIGSVG